MPRPGTPAAEPVFDRVLAINALESELEEAGCFVDVEYSEIQENFTIKRRALRHEVLHKEWLKVLWSGEVLLTLLHRSHKVQSVLAMHKCPLQPVLHGIEHSNWQRLRTQFLCNWQSLYCVLEYLQQFVGVKVGGLDSSGMIIVDCTNAETARTNIMSALAQCFILLGKQPLASISGDCQRLPQPHQQPQEDVHNNNNSSGGGGGGNAPKAAALAPQPKVGRLGSKKRVICIYDTTTSEDADQASIDATPVDNRNSNDAAPKPLVQEPQQLQQHQELPLLPTVADNPDDDGSLLVRVLSRLDEVKAMLLDTSCLSCRQRALDCLPAASPVIVFGGGGGGGDVAAEVAKVTDDAASEASRVSLQPRRQPQPERQSAHSSTAAAAVAAATVLAAAIGSGKLQMVSSAARRRVLRRKVVSKRSAVAAATKPSAGKSAAADTKDATTGFTGDSKAESIDSADTRSSVRQPAAVPPKPTKKKAAGIKQGRAKAKRCIGAAKSTKQQPQEQHQEQPQEQQQQQHQEEEERAEQQRNLEGGGDSSTKQSGDHRNRAASTAAEAAAAVKSTMSGAAAVEATVTDPDGGGGCANGNNHGAEGIKHITKSMVQDLISQLQAVLNEEA